MSVNRPDVAKISADRNLPASWLVTLCEPLVDVATCVALENAMEVRCAQEPQWAKWWFAGLLSDHVTTLPADDPWRRLSARVSADGRDLTRGISPRPPRHTGAVGKYGEFGTVRDGADLLPELPPNVSTDVGLAALGAGLPPASAAVIAFAGDDWRQCAAAIDLILAEELESARLSLFTVLSAATRWSLWRRRAYLSGEDALTLASGFAWLWRAEVLASGSELPERELESMSALRETSSLAHIDYDDVAMDVQQSW